MRRVEIYTNYYINGKNNNSTFLNSLNKIAHSKGFRIASLNVNSLLKHIDELRIMMEKNPLDVLAINESKIDESISDNEVKISGYVACRKDRNRYGGGVLLYVRNCFSFRMRNEFISKQLEMVCIEIYRQYGKPFLVCAWYRPPNSNINLFDSFENFIKQCDVENKDLIILGDLNCDWNKSPLDNIRKI